MKRLNALHPAVLFLYYAVLLVGCVVDRDPVSAAVSLLGAALLAARLSKQGQRLRGLRFYILTFIVVTVANPVFSHNGATPLFFMNDNAFTLEALLYGADQAAMLLAVLLWSRCLTVLMTDDKLNWLLSRLSRKGALVVSMSLRFIPLFIARARLISQAQKGLGLYSSGSFVDRLKERIRVFSAVLTWALEKSVDTASSMRSRGYGSGRATSYRLFRFTGSDCAAFCALVCLTAAAYAVSGLTSVSAFTFYPRLGIIDLSAPAIALYALRLLLCLLPSLTAISEDVVWKYSLSRI